MSPLLPTDPIPQVIQPLLPLTHILPHPGQRHLPFLYIYHWDLDQRASNAHPETLLVKPSRCSLLPLLPRTHDHLRWEERAWVDAVVPAVAIGDLFHLHALDIDFDANLFRLGFVIVHHHVCAFRSARVQLFEKGTVFLRRRGRRGELGLGR